MEKELDNAAVYRWFYSTCTVNTLPKEDLDWFRDFKIGGQVIRTGKYVDDLVLLAREVL